MLDQRGQRLSIRPCCRALSGDRFTRRLWGVLSSRRPWRLTTPTTARTTPPTTSENQGQLPHYAASGPSRCADISPAAECGLKRVGFTHRSHKPSPQVAGFIPPAFLRERRV